MRTAFCLTILAFISLCIATGCRSYGPSSGVKFRSLIGARTISADEKGLRSDSASERLWSVQRLAARGRSDMCARISSLIDDSREPSPSVRAAAAGAVGQLGCAFSASSVAGGLDDPDMAVRINSARTLGTLGAKEYVDLLAEKTQSANEAAEVRIEAIRALGMVGDKRAVPALIERVGDPDQSISFAARRSLVAITGVDFGIDTLGWRSWWNEQSR